MDQPLGTLTIVADPRCVDARASAEAAREVVRANGLEDVQLVADGAISFTTPRILDAGGRFVAVVGDDASFREVAQAVVDAGLVAQEVTLGFIPADPDCDLIKTFGLPPDPRQAARHLLGDSTYDLDLGRVTATRADGAGEVTAVFAQVSEIGAGARLAIGAAGHTGAARRRARFRAYWKAVAIGRAKQMTVRIDKGRWEGKATGVVVGNCPFFHDGLRISPRSFPGDGILDVLVLHGPRSDAITLLPKMYRGEHLPAPGIAEYRAKVGCSVEGPTMPVHADGWVIGTTPARYVIIPRAIRLKI